MLKKQTKKYKKYYGFTLVELIIVITILAILATIAFVSFSGYTGNSRDSNRLFILKEISKSLTIQKEITSKFPLPDDVYATGGINPIKTDLFNVGIIGNGVSNYIKISKVPKDPGSGSEYLYGLEKNNKYFQVAGTLENGEVLGYKLVSQTYANGELKAAVEGNYKGVLKFNHSGKDYIGRIPSLIFSRDGTYSGTGIYILNKDTNLPYKVNTNNLIGPKILNSTGVEITSSLNIEDLLKNNEWKDISKEIIEEEISGKVVSSNGGNGGSSGGGVPPVVIIPTVNGECGSSNNQSLSSAPANNLCTKGTPTEVSGTGPWNWTCSGEGTTKGSDASCSAIKLITCPEGYILVPGSTDFTYSDGSPTKDFCVAKYEMKNVSNVAKSQAALTPWVNISQPNAIVKCNNLGTGYHLITNNEWMTIARNIETNSQNWSNGVIGSTVSSGGGLFRGNINLNDSASCGSNSVLDGNTSGTNCELNGRNKRMHILSNGSEIWDLSGNVWEHVNGTNNISSTSGIVATGNTCGGNFWRSWYLYDGNSVCSFQNGYSKLNNGPLLDYNAYNGVGRIYSSTYANSVFIRGGVWTDGITVGVYTLNPGNDSPYYSTTIGFRCAYTPN